MTTVELDNTLEDPRARATLILGPAGESLHDVTEAICGVAEARHPPKAWYVAMGISVVALGVLGLMVLYLFFTGVGVWNLNRPVCWAFDITNFVFWVGIGHAGTLISAILFLFRQKWRTSINRFAEAMTIFAVMCAGLFPAIHLGRPWFAYWLAPYPNQMGTWPNFLSPLLWDMFAVGTYFTVSLMFWYLGMVPDLATLRDRAVNRWRFYFYGILSLGWRGSQRHWHVYEKAYLLLAALATPLVLSVHSVVSFDFAVAQLPGWHSTIFPPYFVAGAIFSGFAMVGTLAIPARELFGLKDFITKRHLDNMAKIILVTSLMVAYAYSTEFFMAWYGGNPWEQFQFLERVLGPMWWCGWIMLGCNAVVPQLLWFRFARRNVWVLFVVCILINVGMWFERFVIIVVGLHRDFLPSSWGSYCPSYVEVLTLIGSFGLFMTLFLLFCRWLPMVAMAEVKAILPAREGSASRDQGPEASVVSGQWSVDSTSQDLRPKTQDPALWGLLAEYRDAESLRAAAEKVRDAGYKHWECNVPYPVHGLDRAMGVRPTVLPWLVLAAGVVGSLTALGMQWYCNSPSTASAAAGGLSGYPLIFSGKPYLSLPANIPIIFELTVLFASLTAFFGLWALVGLPRLHCPAFASRRFRKATDDGFFIMIRAKDKKFEPARTRKLLAATDCVALEEIHDD
jgi:Ni/Fe-hydrogenase subunit HybB-like protein